MLHMRSALSVLFLIFMLSAKEYFHYLPEWYESSRVQAHTRISLKAYGEKPLFNDASRLFAEQEIPVISRHTHTGEEGAWWQSEVGFTHEKVTESGRNYVQEIIDSAHKYDQRILCYYRHMEDSAWTNRFPEWRTLTDSGAPYTTLRGPVIDIHSPFRDSLIVRLLEQSRMGADGFYFDHLHMPPYGSWSEYSQKAFRKWCGQEMPAEVDLDNPLYGKVKQFYSVGVEEHFQEIVNALHAENPDLVSVISMYMYGKYDTDHLSMRLASIADAPKSEFSIPLRTGSNFIFKRETKFKDKMPDPEVRMAFGLTLLRDAAYGKPPHIWCHRVETEAQALATTMSLLTFGAVANLDHKETELPEDHFTSSYALQKKLGEELAFHRPIRWAGLYVSEDERRRLLPDSIAIWEDLFYPLHGAYAAFKERGVSIGMLLDEQLLNGEADQFAILCIPEQYTLSLEKRAQLEEYKASGGFVITIPQDSNWCVSSPPDSLKKNLWRSIVEQTITSHPTFATIDPQIHMVSQKDRDSDDWLLMLSNSFAWSTPELDHSQPDSTDSISIMLPSTVVAVTDLLTGKELPILTMPKQKIITVPPFLYGAALRVTHGETALKTSFIKEQTPLMTYHGKRLHIAKEYEGVAKDIRLYSVTGREIWQSKTGESQIVFPNTVSPNIYMVDVGIGGFSQKMMVRF